MAIGLNMTTVYHVQSGNLRRALSQNSYQLPRTLTIKELGQRLLQKDRAVEEQCEFILNPYSKIPAYKAYRGTHEGLPEIRESSPQLKQRFYVYSGPLEVEKALLPSYEAITQEKGGPIPQEIGPLGLFSILESGQWKPLDSIRFFQENAPLDDQMTCASLGGRAIIVVTDITGSEEDANRVPPLNPEQEFVPNF